MDISKLKVFNLIQANMNYLGARQDVFAQNISNSNTPGYDSKTIAPMDFKAVLSGRVNNRVTVAATSATHIAGLSGNAQNEYHKENSKDIFEITPTGNKVVLEQEMMQLTKNNMEYQQTTSIYKKMLQMMKTTLGDNS